MGQLTLLLLLPLVALVATLVMPAAQKGLIRKLALLCTLLQLGLVLAFILPHFLSAHASFMDFRIEEKAQWIRLDLGDSGLLNIEYHLALDGISLVMVLLTSLILPIVAYRSFQEEKRVKVYFALFLLLDLTMIGCFIAADFFLFYLLYEFMLLPMFFLIGLWGGPRREYAAIKFFLYTLFGSVFMLLIMVGLAFSFTDPDLSAELGRPVFTFDLMHMMPNLQGQFPNMVPDSIFASGMHLLGFDARSLAFVVLFIGFAIKVPSVPVHTWLPDAHVEASTPISVALAAVLLKVGAYGIIRLCYGLFPDAAVHQTTLVAVLGMISILYGALVAMSQKDLKAMIAYSSISHMGFVLLGIASCDPAGLDGAVFQMFNHGIASAALFLLAGVLYDRTHDREILHYRGLWSTMPKYTAVVLVTFFASMGLPGLNGFISEMLTLFGSFKATQDAMPIWIPILSVLGIVFAAVYFLRTFRQMFFGEFSYQGTGDAATLTDLKWGEIIVLVPLVAGMVVFGIFPSLILSLMDAALSGYASLLSAF
jgi:NADH-quinone oxidoreductase subunit M